MASIFDLIGLKIQAIKYLRLSKNDKYCKPELIMFDDGRHYIELEDQDYDTYHDCNCGAKVIRIYDDKKVWESIMGDRLNYVDANMEISY